MSAALQIKDLRKEYRRGVPVLQGISLEIAPRGVTAIIGPSGTGKSTLIRCINRLVEPTSGSILFEGRDLTRLNARELRLARRQIGMVFQEYNLVERLTVMENLLTGRLGYVSAFNAWLRRYPPADIERAFALLDEVGLGGFARQRLGEHGVGYGRVLSGRLPAHRRRCRRRDQKLVICGYVRCLEEWEKRVVLVLFC